jgi:hypothetical protein
LITVDEKLSSFYLAIPSQYFTTKDDDFVWRLTLASLNHNISLTKRQYPDLEFALRIIITTHSVIVADFTR